MESIYEVKIEKGSKIKHEFELHKGSRVKINGARTYTLTQNAILLVDVPDFARMKRDTAIKAMVVGYQRSKRVTDDKA